MKRFKAIFSILMSVTLLACLLPAAHAVSGEAVLTSLKHDSTDAAAVGAPSAKIVLYVVNSYVGLTLDLSDKLTIGFDTAKYKNVVAAPSGPATIDNDISDNHTITLHVTFNNIDDADGAVKSLTNYSVQVVRSAAVQPTFAGTLVKETTVPGLITFIGADFTPKYTKNDGADITDISINGSNPSFGALKRNGVAYIFGDPIPLTQIAQLSFSATSTGTVSYDVAAYQGSDTAPNKKIGNVVLTISAFTVPMIKTAIASSVAKGTILKFDPAYFTDHCDMSGAPLFSVEITPTNTTYGSWTVGSQQFTSTKTIAAADLGGLSFTATMPGNATFNWRLSNKAGFSATGSGVITVTSPALTLSPSPVTPPSILKGGTYTISPADFQFKPAAALSYIKLATVPAAADGYLYLTSAVTKNDTYGVPALAANTALAANAVIPIGSVADLRLATKSASTNAKVSFNWTATTDLKVTAATWATASSFTVNFIAGSELTYTTEMNVPVSFSSSGLATLIGNQFVVLTGLQLSYLTFALPDKNAGTLFYMYDVTTAKGTAVTAATKYYAGKSPNLADITFAPVKDYIGKVTVTFNAYADTGATLTGTIVITVKNESGGTLSLQTDKNTPLQLDAGQIQAAFAAATGKSLSYIVFTSLPASSGTAAPTASGSLSYNCDPTGRGGTTVTTGSRYNILAVPYLSLVSFVPYPDSVGKAVILFDGYTANGAEVYGGKLVITVVDSAAGIVSYTVRENGSAGLLGADFSNEFVSVTGSLLSYVTITPPPATSGMLYESYDAAKKSGKSVSAATKYYDGKTPDISGLTFVPAKDYVGTVVVAYKAFNAAGASFAGKLKFIVMEGSQLISYGTSDGAPITMVTGDFINSYSLMSGGKELSSVAFELPSPVYGKLYYNYFSPTQYDAAVTVGTKYSLSAAPLLSCVSFVPSSSYNGTFTFSYTAYGADGVGYTGKIRITVTAGYTGAIRYTTNSLSPVTFNATDFMYAYTGGGTLNYVIFSQPYASYGTLYQGYTSASSPGSALSAWSAFYVGTGAWPSVSSVTFVPNSSYSGTLAIPYTAYSTTGATSQGTVLITIKGGDLDAILYAGESGTPVPMLGEDFSAAFLQKTGESLSYVIFALPPAEAGRLYLGYLTAGSYTAAVTYGARYYRSYTPLLSDVSFVPTSGFSGTVIIAYTGYTTGGTGYNGKVIINVGAPVPFPDMKAGYEWAAPAVSWLYTNGVVRGSDDGRYHPNDDITRGDFILMVTRAFGLGSETSDNFPDVPPGVYYYSAIATAKEYGIVTGADGKFRPTAYLSRQDAAVIVYRTLSFMGVPVAEGSPDDIAAFPDAGQVSDYAVSAMATLVKAGVLTGAGGMLNPKAMITRAEMAVILYKVLML